MDIVTLIIPICNYVLFYKTSSLQLSLVSFLQIFMYLQYKYFVDDTRRMKTRKLLSYKQFPCVYRLRWRLIIRVISENAIILSRSHEVKKKLFQIFFASIPAEDLKNPSMTFAS